LDTRIRKVGDEVVAELRFINIGKEPQRFPLSSRWETANDEKCEWLGFRPGMIAQRGWVRLEFADGAGYTEFIGSHPLFSNSSDPNSYRMLAPGQSIRVKLGGKIYFQRVYEERKPEDKPFTLPQEFGVTASFSLDDSSLWNPYKKLRSTNPVRVRVVPPE